ncbi:MAG: penicillin-binding protein, partial [Clostridia bacterium]|nr:penicillin-binding protein [Clostridia bacterium]
MKNKSKKKIILSLIILSIIIFVVFCILFYIKLDKNIDLSLINPTGSSITKIYYFDYEDRQNRIGKPVELKEERIFFQKSEWKNIYDIPQDLKDAFIAIEDKRFFNHNGVDWGRTIKATINYIFGRDKSSFGGSTITQQLIKNLTGDNKTTPKRKAEEIFRALNLEKEVSKNKILETYLNIVYLSQNCYGVSSAAELYFNKPIEDLSLSECATLASIVKNPKKYDPYVNPDENNKRKNLVLKEMLMQGYITENEYKTSISEEIKVNSNISQEAHSGIYSWYTETLISEVSKDLSEKYDINERTARMMILKGGLNIYSTIDPNLQNIAESVYSNYKSYLKKQNEDYPESSCVIMDVNTSDVLAIIGGKGKKNSNMILNRAISIKRPPGSVIK